MNWVGRLVLVTGGAGFVGSHLVQRLLDEGARVRILDNLSTGLESNLRLFSDSVDFIEGDLRNATTCGRATRGCEVVFHQAALGSVPRSVENPVETLDVNVVGSARLFEAAVRSGVRRVVYASSSSVYGNSTNLLKVEGNEGIPLSPYAASKAALESLAHAFQMSYATDFFGLRYFNIYGPRQSPQGPYAAVVPRFFAACRSGRSMIIFGDGTQSRDFTFVEDAVEANFLAVSAAAGGVVNVARGATTTILDLAEKVAESMGRSADIKFTPPRPSDVLHSHASLDLAQKTLGYVPRFSLEAGLQLMATEFERK